MYKFGDKQGSSERKQERNDPKPPAPHRARATSYLPQPQLHYPLNLLKYNTQNDQIPPAPGGQLISHLNCGGVRRGCSWLEWTFIPTSGENTLGQHALATNRRTDDARIERAPQQRGLVTGHKHNAYTSTHTHVQCHVHARTWSAWPPRAWSSGPGRGRTATWSARWPGGVRGQGRAVSMG